MNLVDLVPVVTTKVMVYNLEKLEINPLVVMNHQRKAMKLSTPQLS